MKFSPDPFDDIMVRVIQFGLEHFQVAHFEPRRGEGDLKVHGDRRPSPLLLGVRGEKLNLGGYLRLLHAAHPLDLPYNRVLARLVLGLALHADELHAAGVQRGRDPNLDLLRQQRGLEVGLDHHLDLELGAAHLPHQGDHAERERDVLRSRLFNCILYLETLSILWWSCIS